MKSSDRNSLNARRQRTVMFVFSAPILPPIRFPSISQAIAFLARQPHLLCLFPPVMSRRERERGEGMQT